MDCRNVSESSWTISAPGKLILFGEHAVVYGHPAIAVAIGLRCYFQITRKSSESRGGIHIQFPDFSEVEFELTQPNEFTDWSMSRDQILENARTKMSTISVTDSNLFLGLLVCNYLFLRAAQIHRNQSQNEPSSFLTHSSIRIEVRSEIPIGSGLGSSAAFCTAAVASFFLLIGYLSAESILSDEQKNCIQSLAHEAECLIHGRASGVDTAIAVRGSGLWVQRNKNDLSLSELHNIPKILPSVIIVNSSVSRSASTAIEIVSNRYQKDPETAELLSRIGKVVDEANRLLDSSDGEANLAPLIRSNQDLLEKLGVSHPKIREIVSIADQLNMEAKLTGAGLGGYVFAVPRNKTSTEQLQHTVELMKQHFWCQVVTLSVPGVVVSRTP